MNTNPIRFSDIFNFEDAPAMLKAASESMQELNNSSKQFFKTILSPNMDKLLSQNELLIKSLQSISAETEKANLQTKEGQQLVISSVQAVQSLNTALQENSKLKKANADSEKALADSVNGLNDKLREQMARFNSIGGSSEEGKKKMKELGDQIIDTKNKIDQLNTSLKETDKTMVPTNSINGLKNTLKDLKDQYNNLSTSSTNYSARSKELADQIRATEAQVNSLTAALKKQPAASTAPIITPVAQDSIAGLTEKLRQMESQFRTLSTTSANYDAVAKQLAADIIFTKNEIDQFNAVLKTTVSVQQAAVGSYAALDAETKKLIVDLKQMAGGMDAGNAQARAMQMRIYDNIAALKNFDAQMNIHNRSVGNYAKATFAVSQVLREAPAFAYSFATGLLGISNNIPILVDQINALKESNAALAAQGMKTVPIWRIFSDALTSPVGMITIFTAAITIFAARMKTTEQTVMDVAKANDALAKSFEGVIAELIKLQKEQEAYNLLNNNDAVGRDAIEENTVAGYKRIEEALKALGVIHGEVYTQEKALMKAANETRDQEIKDIEKQQAVLQQLDDFRIHAQGLNWKKTNPDFIDRMGNSLRGDTQEGTMNTALRNADLPAEEKKKLRLALDEALAKDADIEGVLDKIMRRVGEETVRNNEAVKQKKAEQRAAELDFVQKHQRAVEALDMKMDTEHRQNQEKQFQEELSIRNKDYDQIALSIKHETDFRLGELKREKEETRKLFADKGQQMPGSLVTDFSQRETDIKKAEALKQGKLLQDYYTELGKLRQQASDEADEYFDKLEKLRKELAAILLNQETLSRINDIKLKQAGNVNPMFATFGVADNQSKFEADQDIRDENIIKAEKRRAALMDELRTEQDAERLLGRATDFEKELDLEAKLGTAETDLQQQKSDKAIAIAQREADAKKLIYQKTYQLAVQFIESTFTRQKEALDRQMEATQVTADFERNLAGDNSAAKIKISQAEQAKMLELKRKQAQVDKEQAIFSATISILQGVASALSQVPPYSFILAALVTAAGFKTISDISSKPLPQYWGGRDGGPAEYAMVNEKGPEAIGQNGKYRIVGGGMPTITSLEAGDSVFTYEQTSKMMGAGSVAKNWMDTLLEGTGAYRQVEAHKEDRYIAAVGKGSMTQHEFREVMMEFTNAIPAPVIEMPAQGVSDRLTALQVKNGLG